MEKEEVVTTPRQVRNRYRLVVMNDDTYEEVVTFKLTRLSVYVGMSTMFVLMVGFAVALLVFTPLKYYIPGYGRKQSRQELQALKIRTDSLERAILQKEQYLKSVKSVLTGDISNGRDTTVLDLPQPEYTND
ncbi:MAG TPA: hypothetical protein VF145_13485 [Chitinophagaceae bacterium]